MNCLTAQLSPAVNNLSVSGCQHEQQLYTDSRVFQVRANVKRLPSTFISCQSSSRSNISTLRSQLSRQRETTSQRRTRTVGSEHNRSRNASSVIIHGESPTIIPAYTHTYPLHFMQCVVYLSTHNLYYPRRRSKLVLFSPKV